LRETIGTIVNEGPRAAMIKGGRRAKFVIDIATATRKLRSDTRTTESVEESLELAFGFSTGTVTIAPAQVRSEIAALLELLEADPPQNILEIGTARGGTLFLLSRVASPDATLVSIDRPGGEFGGGYSRLWIPLLKALPRKGQRLFLLRADSHQARTQEATRQSLGGKSLDFLLIDGDHRFDGIRQDFLMYGPLVRPGGLIAIHDIVPAAADKVGGVPAFWEWVKDTYETRELVEDWSQEGFGIGLVQVPAQGLDLTRVDRTVAKKPDEPATS
jgi:predicted O-methyltransferase YrrM